MPDLLSSLAFLGVVGAILIVFIQAIAPAIQRWQTIFDDPHQRAVLTGLVVLIGTAMVLWSLTMMPLAFGMAP